MTASSAYAKKDNWSDTWLTPPALVKALGPFDTDPCCPPKMPWRTAKRMITKAADGLTAEWIGRVWMNPPYSDPMPWVDRFIRHGSGIALLNGRTIGTRATQRLMTASYCVMFLAGRLEFCFPDGTPSGGKWFPSMLIGMLPNDYMSMISAAKEFPGVMMKPMGRRS